MRRVNDISQLCKMLGKYWDMELMSLENKHLI
jgi:hypothetical protein